jgi:hypothetical protein
MRAVSGWLGGAVTGSFALFVACGVNNGTDNSIGRNDVSTPAGGAAGQVPPVGAGGSISGPPMAAPEMTAPIFTTDQARDAGVKKACGSVQVPAKVETVEHVTDVPGNVLFVFDQSGSMNEAWNGSTKIQGAIDAINKAFAPVQGKLNAGAIFFPHVDPGTNGCNWATDWLTCLLTLPTAALCLDADPITTPPQIQIQPGAQFLTAWNAYWAPPVAAKGSGTPTEKGILAGEAALGTPPPGNTVMVLVTDGAPTCGMNEQAAPTRLLQKNIKTYVIGLPGAAGTTVLDAVAIAGGTAPMGCTTNCFVSPSDATALQQIFANIATTVVTTTKVVSVKDCSFQLMPPDMSNPADVHLVVTDIASGMQYEVPQGPMNGWTLSADYKSATLTGSICDGAKAGTYSNFNFQYGCVMVPPLPIR